MRNRQLPESVVEALARVPREPGCYIFRGDRGTVLYVGKARSLRPRVRSYFHDSARSVPKTEALVTEVRELEFIVTKTEIDALILESNLIKEHRPRYNVLLRDDKNFPYLKLTGEDEFPRVNLVRQPKSDGSSYFGPFLPASHARRTLRMIPRFFQVANCHLRFDGKQRPCLYYHLDQCLAPCAGKADRARYLEQVEQVRLFLEGRDEELASRVRDKMLEASEGQQFEQAARYRDMLDSLRRLTEKSQMSSVGLEAIDFWAEYREGERAAAELFRMREGRIIGRREFTFENASQPDRFYDEILPQFYVSEMPAAELVLPRLPEDSRLIETFLTHRRGSRVRLRAPSQGERRRFLDLVARNARLAFEAKFRAPHVHRVEMLEELRDAIELDEVPFRIEGFDVSHLRGTNARASMVVFEGGAPKKSDYRVYKVKPAEPGDDYAALGEVVARRYGRLLREGKRLPDLVLIDGGRGQLAAAMLSLEALGLGSLPVVALAKREEELFLERGGDALLLDRHNPALHLVQQIRDEAHRFALSHHRKARGRRMSLGSALTRISGIGDLTARRLLQQFGSVEGVREASLAALAGAIGPAKAKLVQHGLKPSSRPDEEAPDSIQR